MKKLFVFLGLVCLSVATQASAQTINPSLELKSLENWKSVDIESLRNYFNDNNIRILDNTLYIARKELIYITSKELMPDRYPLLHQPKDSTNKIFHIHGKRGDNNIITFEDINNHKDNRHLRDTYQHPEEPKTKLKIEPTPKVIKPKIIPLESH